jgi:hypothetical protein
VSLLKVPQFNIFCSLVHKYAGPQRNLKCRFNCNLICLTFKFCNISGTRIETPTSCAYQGTSKYFILFMYIYVGFLQVHTRLFALLICGVGLS